MSDLIERGTRCTARRKSGQPCSNWAIRGSNVCRMHGGGAPQVKRAAMVRLLLASDSLMAQLLLIALDKSEPTPVRLAAIRDALDRAGLSAKEELAVDVKVSRWDESVAAVIVEHQLIDAAVSGDYEEPLATEEEPDESTEHDEITEAIDNARRKRARRGKSRALTTRERAAIESRHTKSRRSSVEPEPPPPPPPSRPNHPGPPPHPRRSLDPQPPPPPSRGRK